MKILLKYFISSITFIGIFFNINSLFITEPFLYCSLNLKLIFSIFNSNCMSGVIIIFLDLVNRDV